MDLFSMRDLKDVYIKALRPIEIDGKQIEPGEVLLAFDKLQIVQLQEIKEHVAARGGYDNRGRVFWDTTREIRIQFCAGVFSKLQFGLLSTSKLIKQEKQEQSILVSVQEKKETDEEGVVQLSHVPARNLFLYRRDTGEKLAFTQEGESLHAGEPYLDVLASYEWEFQEGVRAVQVGNNLLSGFVSFEAKTRIQDDKTGEFGDVLIKIPKMKLVSDLSIRLGDQANPVVANFAAVGVPVGSRGGSYVAEFTFLDGNL